MYKSVLREITCNSPVFVRQRGRDRKKDRVRDLMNVSASADRLPPKRLLVAIETPGEEIKKGRE